MITITAIQEIPVQLQGQIANAVVNFSQHDVSLVSVTATSKGKTFTGFGFNSIGRFAQSGILKTRLIPRVLAAAPEELVCADGSLLDPAAVAIAAMRNEKPGGHGDRASAFAALELAIWDLNGKVAGEPAYQMIARSAGREIAHPSVDTYAAGGYYYESGYEGLKDELSKYKALGYQRCKIKIGGASLDEDMARFDIAAETMGGTHLVAVDANGRFDKESAGRYLDAFNGRKPAWFEEPIDPLDYQGLKALVESTDIPIATGENLFSLIDSINLINFSGMRKGKDIFQMDAGLSYGLSEYIQIKDRLVQSGYSLEQLVPHGGHLINLHIVAGLGLGGCEAYPGVFQPFGGFSPECQIAGGQVQPSSAPGFGLEEKPELAPFLEQVTKEQS